MRTTLDLDKSLLEEAAELTGQKSLSAAVNKALAEYIRRRKLDELRILIKTTELNDVWQELEDVEMKESVATSK